MRSTTTSCLALLLLASCEGERQSGEQEEASSVKEGGILETEYEGDWIYVGPAHPWHWGDSGIAGAVSISGETIRFDFVRSPYAGLSGELEGLFDFTRDGEVRSTYIGNLTTSMEDWPADSVPEGWFFISDTDSFLDGMPVWSFDEHGILVGGFDPPFLFRSPSAPPVKIDEPDVEDEVEDDDPFASD